MTEGRSRLSDQLHLYSYWRSSAAYRVRIGLNLKGLAYETLPVHLVLPVLELVRGRGVAARDDRGASREREDDTGSDEPGALGSWGRLDHRKAIQLGKKAGLTVTPRPHTLRYLRFITWVGISVSRIPSAAMPTIATAASFQSTHWTMLELGRSLP